MESIRKYFTPIQPSVKPGNEQVVYEEFESDEQLSPLIHCYWRLRSDQQLETPYTYRVVSDGCVDVFFNLKNTEESFVMGFFDKYTEFSIGKEFDYAGIRFYPSIFPQIFEASAKSLSNKDQVLALNFPELAKFIAAEIHGEFEPGIPKLNQFFLALLKRKKREIDPRFQAAFLEILKRKGHLETESELDYGISPRQLRRLFNYYIGTTPKSFCQVVRFQYILNAKPSSQSLKENKIYYDIGFFDQAHFIRNFTKFYGVTPTKALS